MTLFDKGNEFELLRRIQALEQRNLEVSLSVGDADASQSTVPQVTGISLGTGVGTFTVLWNEVTGVTVRNYEVLIATSPDFEGATTRTTTALEYTFHGGSPATTYYVKVRATTAGGSGAFSATLNTTTGVASFLDLQAGAATAFVSDEVTPGIFGEIDVTPGFDTVDLGNAVMDVEFGAVVVPFVTAEVDYDYRDSVSPITLTVELLRNGALTGDIFTSAFPSFATGTITVGSFTTPDEPGEGTVTYALRWTLAGSLADIAVVNQKIDLVQFLQGV